MPDCADHEMPSQRCMIPHAPLAFVWLESDHGDLLAAAWQDPDVDLPPPTPRRDLPELRPTAFEVAAYVRDPAAWRPPVVLPAGSLHARRVWEALAAIPPGEVRTYAEIARAIGSAPRAVGHACRANPWPLFIPCHRVVPAGFHRKRDAGGYAGDLDGLLATVKQALLRHEGWSFPST